MKEAAVKQVGGSEFERKAGGQLVSQPDAGPLFELKETVFTVRPTRQKVAVVDDLVPREDAPIRHNRLPRLDENVGDGRVAGAKGKRIIRRVG